MLGRTFTSTGLRCLLVTGLISAFVATADADVQQDRYILGYATALLEQQFKVQVGSLQVKDGVILIQAKDVPAPDHDKIKEALQKINGVVRVDIVDVPASVPTPTAVS